MTPNELKPGDRVRVTIEGVFVQNFYHDGNGVHIRIGSGLELTDVCVPKVLATIELLPPKAEPLKVGEVVWYAKRQVDYVVKGMFEDEVWIGRELETIICAPESLIRPNGIPIPTGEEC